MARRAMTHDDGEPSLAALIERSAELKRALVDYALSPRFGRHLEQFLLEAADPYQELSESEAIGVIDRFALQHRLRNGKTVLAGRCVRLLSFATSCGLTVQARLPEG